ncbi:hypothetical protein A2415_04275 [candidate division WWE3 bacterium RIFOXYC1_FULL_39_7]|uniref:Uncharacterized protein n=2 Tax=Katanobacteria TaxID=422282 RepID=A0A1F4X7M2_UNCKA|nr:MAG: hypothetical protein A2415_04275 [candidate division WWE3 bacterium RIFOXYC1_FULL_39_7]OGC77666.1 MAG: hypothetical protein A2619_05530 [candidate division WWE3 bacterium RIFOXYD1_FULL_39_9]
MKHEAEKYFTTFLRSYKNTDFLLKLYGIWLVIVLVVFGFYGIRPLFMTLKEKSSVLAEMQLAKTALNANEAYLKKSRSDLYEYRTNISFLNTFMPLEPEIQTYILDLIGAIGDQGYIMRNFSQSGYADEANTIELHVQMDGASYPSGVIKKIEGLKRITNVKSVDLNRQLLSTRVQYKVRLYILIYTQPK